MIAMFYKFRCYYRKNVVCCNGNKNSNGDVGMDKLIHTAAARQALSKVEDTANRIRTLIQHESDFSNNYDRLHTILDDSLGRDEYFVIVDGKGQSYIHTNRLLEGTVF